MYRVYYIIYIYINRRMHTRSGGRWEKENRKIICVEMRDGGDGGLDDIANRAAIQFFFVYFPVVFLNPFGAQV